MKNPRVLFVCSNNAGVNFWRMYQFFRSMSQKGLETAISGYDPEDKFVGTWQFRLAKDVKLQETIHSLFNNADVIVMQYYHAEIALALQLMYQQEFNKKILCEIDDYLIDVPHYNPVVADGGLTAGNNIEKIVIEQMKSADKIITSTDYLGEQYKRFNKNISTISNSIDFTKWNFKNNNKFNKKIKIGWIGGANHYEDLRILEQIIPIIQEKYKNKIEFTIVCGIPDYLKRIKNIKLVKKNVNIDKYPEFIASQGFDIGLAPLVYNRFNMAKSNLRWLEYGSLKVPCVASNIEPYAKSIVNGKTGYLCDGLNDWITNISTLIENEQLRKDIGKNELEEIENKYNLSNTIDKYIKIIRGI